MISELNLNTVYLMLGNACNFSCRHCIQTPFEDNIKKRPSDKLIKYIQHLADIRPRNTFIPSSLSVLFWGGEPFLYLDQMKEIVEKLDRESIRFVTVTNGAKLTEKTIDWINDIGMEVYLSNDGKDTAKVRDYNVLDSEYFCSMFRGIKKRSIDSVIHAYNLDYHELWDYLEEKVAPNNITCEFLNHTWNMPEDIYKYDYEKYLNSCLKVKDSLIEKFKNNDYIGSREHKLFYDVIKHIRHKDFEFPSCRSWKGRVDVDLEGNVWSCHNGFNKFGTVDLGKKIITIGKEIAEKKMIENNKPCGYCPVKDLCRGGCMYSCPELEKPSCTIRQIFYLTVLSFLDELGEEYTTEIEL